MASRHRIRRSFFFLAAGLFSASGAAYAFIEYDGGDYSQNFNGLQGGTWTNNVSLPGWYAFRSVFGDGIFRGRAGGFWEEVSQPGSNSYRNSNGQRIDSGHGYALNLGSSADRVGVFTLYDDITFALVLRNATTNSIGCFTLQLDCEQWQVNTTVSPPTTGVFSYGVFDSFASGAGLAQINPSTIVPHQPDRPDDFYNGYTRDTTWDLNAFVFGNTVLPLNGDAGSNRVRKISTVPGLNWMPGQYLVLRWFADYRNDAPSQMLGVDDLVFSTTPLTSSPSETSTSQKRGKIGSSSAIEMHHSFKHSRKRRDSIQPK